MKILNDMKNKILNDMKNMPLGTTETIKTESSQTEVVRVPGGWLYVSTYCAYDGGAGVTSTFVPLPRTE